MGRFIHSCTEAFLKQSLLFFALIIVLSVRTSVGQTVSIFDTVYTPPGDPDGAWIATVFVPTVGNGIGAVLAHGSGVSRQTVRGWCDTLAARGYVAMTVEYPDAEAYPNPPRALKLAVQFLRRNAARFGITTNKVIGLGTSMGAITWGEAIVWDNDFRYFDTDSTISDHLDAAILLYGDYGSAFSYSNVSTYFGNDTLRYLKGTPIYHVENITTPVLLLHGTSDATVPYQGSVGFYDSLVAHGKVCELVLFPGQAHGFDLNFPVGTFTPAGFVAKDSAMAFLRRTVAPALRIRVSSSVVDFGPLLLSTRDTTIVRVDNIGDRTLHLYSASLGNTGFNFANIPSFPLAIQPGGSTQLAVSFKPAAPGNANDTISLASDDPLHPVVKIGLQGKGIASVAPATGGVMYTTSVGVPTGHLLKMNLADGALDTLGPLNVPEIRALAIRHSDGVIYGVNTTPAPSGVFQISAPDGEAALLKRLPIGNLGAVAFSPEDTLYGASTTGTLYRIDLATGRVDSLGTSFRLAYSSLAFRPGSGELWASVRTPTDSIYRLNRDDGAAIPVGATGFNAVTSSIAFAASGALYGLIDNGTGEDYLATIDTVNASGSIVAGPLSVTYLRAMTMTGGTTSISGKDQNPRGTPLTFALGQNYPNPFNPKTVISSQLPVASNVKLVVYDVLGREVATLVNERRAAGYYRDTFDASGLGSGFYICRLSAGTFVAVRKMLLVK
jgi:acetyl esterase/lipase